jgi:hypothetical protein
MANRGIQDQALLDAIGAQTVQYYECIFIDINDGIYITNAPRDITIGSDTYNAFGQLLSMDAINENTTFQIPSLKLGISGIDPYETTTNTPVVQYILENIHIDRNVTIDRVYYDHDAYIGGFEVFAGNIVAVEMSHSPTEGTTILIDVSSHWADFNKGSGRRTNPNSQQQYYPNDKGFEYAKNTMTEIEWKEEG